MAEVAAVVLCPLEESCGHCGQEGSIPVEWVVFQHEGVLAEVGEDFLEFGGGFAVVLLDGELQGGFKDGFGVLGLSTLEEGFAEEDTGEHPVVTGIAATLKVWNGGDGLTFFAEGLGEAETEEHIVGLCFDFSKEGFGFGHGLREG